MAARTNDDLTAAFGDRQLSDRQSWTLAGVLWIVGLTLLVYWPALRGPFILDDERYVTDNALVAAPDGLQQIWFSDKLIDYWPLTYTTFWFEWRLWGMNPTGYHLANLLLHMATSLLLWKVLQKLAIPGAFLGALLFAVHPVNVEAVAWVSQRNEMLAAFFLMLSVMWFVEADDAQAASGGAVGGKWYGLSLAAFVLALLSKISVVSMPAALLLILWWRHGRVGKWDFVRVAPYFGMALVMVFVQLAFQKHGDPIPNPSWAERLAGSGNVVWFYFSKAFLPLNQSYFYSHWNIQTSNILWWMPLVAAVMVTTMLWRQRNSAAATIDRAMLLAWGFFCIALAPATGLIQNGFMVYALVADRYEHLAIIGVVAMVAAAWSFWQERSRESARSWVQGMAIAVVGVLCVLTWQRSRLFGDSVKLYAATLEHNSDPRAKILFDSHLADLLLSRGQIPEAIEHYKIALELQPKIPEAHNNLGNALMAAGRTEEAIAHYEAALQLRPDYVKTHCNLGSALTTVGQPQKAVEQFEAALALEPGNAEANFLYANMLAKAGRGKEAVEHYEAAIRSQPNYAEAHNNFGSLLVGMNRLNDAIEQYNQALRSNPEYAEAENNLAIALASSGHMPQAIEHFQRALLIEPNNADSHYNLGVALLDSGRFQEAVKEFNTVLRLQPNRLPTFAKLANAYVQLRQPADAIATAEKGLEMARASGQTELAQRIEAWLETYRKNQAEGNK